MTQPDTTPWFNLRFVFALTLLSAAAAIHAQSSSGATGLPNAPELPLLAMAQQSEAPPSRPSASSPSEANPRLTLADAENTAIKNNPRVSIGRLLALAQHQVVREARSAELPTANGSITAVQAEDASRISAGSITASRLFTHAGAGGGFTQLITDFGKTGNLIAASKLRELSLIHISEPTRQA